MQGIPHPLDPLLKLVVKTHEVEGVKTVDDGGAHRALAKHNCRVASPCHWFELVFTPGILHVGVPRLLGHLNWREVREGGREGGEREREGGKGREGREGRAILTWIRSELRI